MPRSSRAVLVSSAFVLCCAVPASAARAEPRPATAVSQQAENAFDRLWGLGVGYAYWDGSYASQGVATRARWEPLEFFGVELTMDLLASPGERIDIPFGFFLYAPLAITHDFRVRPLAGLCGMISAGGKGTPDGARQDDVQLGFRLGAGLEYAVSDTWSLYGDATWQRYYGHAKEGSGWTADLTGDIVPTDRVAVAIGLGFHL